jgi:hypothetical protein
MADLEFARKELAKVGGILAKDMSNPRIKSILMKLKSIDTELKNIINGVEEEFSFDNLNEGQQPVRRPQSKRVQESASADFGVDLGGFDNFVNQGDPDGFDWRQTMREANGQNHEQDLGNWDSSAPAYAETLGRMIDNT